MPPEEAARASVKNIIEIAVTRELGGEIDAPKQPADLESHVSVRERVALLEKKYMALGAASTGGGISASKNTPGATDAQIAPESQRFGLGANRPR